MKKTAVKKPAAKKTAPKKAAPATANKKPAAATPLKKATAPKAKTNGNHKLYDLIMGQLAKEKGENLVSIDLAGKSAIADYMIIVSGTSGRHVAAMAEKIKGTIGKEGFRCRIEGKTAGDWVILDAGDVIVHLFRPEVRAFYNLEKLWMSDFSTVGYNLYTKEK